MLPGLQVGQAHAIPRAQLHPAEFDQNATATGHCITGVETKVEQHLLKLSLVCDQLTRFFQQGDAHLDVLAQYPPQHVGHVSDEHVGIEGHCIQSLAAAEHQQLPRQLDRPLRRPLDVCEVLLVGG